MPNKSDEEEEQASSIKHATNYLLPAYNTASQATIMNKQTAFGFAILDTYADVQDMMGGLKEALRQNNGNKEHLISNLPCTKGEAIAFTIRRFTKNYGDRSVAIDGRVRREGLCIAVSNKTGIAMTVKKPSLWQRMRGKGSETTLVPQNPSATET